MLATTVNDTPSHEVSPPDTMVNSVNDVEKAGEEPARGHEGGVGEDGSSNSDEQTQGQTAEKGPEQVQVEPYCAFTKNTKLFIVLAVSLAGFFSPFSINIYIPALPQISNVLGTSEGE